MKALVLFVATVISLSSPLDGYGYLPRDTRFFVESGGVYSCLFMLPETYFVLPLEDCGEYIRVGYLDLEGYVTSGAYETVSFEPKYKYATGGKLSFRAGVASVYLYADSLCTVALCTVSSADSLLLYGKSDVDGVYYCRASLPAEIRGYIKGDGVVVTLPPANTVEAIADDPSEEEPNEPPSPELTLPMEIALVLCLTLPAILVVFLLTKKKDKNNDE